MRLHSASRLPTAPGPFLISTDPTPRDLTELCLDLMKKILTCSLVAKRMERHTIAPRGPRSKCIHAFNKLIAGLGLELVRLTRSTPEDYLESGHEASNRVEDAETMLGTRQLDHIQNCIVDVLHRDVAGDVLEAGVWRGGMTIFMRALLRAYACTTPTVWAADSFEGLPPIDSAKEEFPWEKGDMAVSLGEVRDNFARYGLLDGQVQFLKGFSARRFRRLRFKSYQFCVSTRIFTNPPLTSYRICMGNFLPVGTPFSTIIRICWIAGAPSTNSVKRTASQRKSSRLTAARCTGRREPDRDMIRVPSLSA